MVLHNICIIINLHGGIPDLDSVIILAARSDNPESRQGTLQKGKRGILT